MFDLPQIVPPEHGHLKEQIFMRKNKKLLEATDSIVKITKKNFGRDNLFNRDESTCKEE